MTQSPRPSVVREVPQGVFLVDVASLPEAPEDAQGIVIRDRSGAIMAVGWVPKERRGSALRDSWAHFDENGDPIAAVAASRPPLVRLK